MKCICWIARPSVNRLVAGSNPARGAKHTYSLDTVGPITMNMPFGDPVRDTHMSVQSLEDVDKYILDFLDHIDALDRR